MGQFVQAHRPSMQKFQTHFLVLGALDLNFTRSAWRCDLSDGMLDFWKFVNDSFACDAFKALLLIRFVPMRSESYPSVVEVPVKALLVFPFTYASKDCWRNSA